MNAENTPPKPTPAEAARLLQWYAAMGVDVALEDTPQDRFAQPEPVRPAPETRAPAAAPLATAPQDEAVTGARELAQSASTLEELRERLMAFDGCALKRTATQLVFADGKPGSRVMLIGEAPGRDEDREGLPFVGRSGQLLDRMLAAIGLARGDVYIANVVPWRPPGNRTPTPQETQMCLPFLQRQIELCAPEFLILLGGAAAQTLTGAQEGVLKMRGRWFDVSTPAQSWRALVTLHPAYLLRSPVQKRLAWRDFRALRAALDGQHKFKA